MRQAYGKIFWGLLITIFDINIGRVNLLPNFIGYFIIGSGILKIREGFEHEAFKKACGIAYFLTAYSLILSALNVIGANAPIGNHMEYKSVLSIGLGLFSASLDLIMGFSAFSGTIALYLHKERPEEADLTEKSKRKYTVLSVAALILMLLAINISGELYYAFVLFYGICVRIYFAYIISRIKNSFNEDLMES